MKGDDYGFFLEPNAEYFVSKWGIWWDVYNSDKSRKVDDALLKKKEKGCYGFLNAWLLRDKSTSENQSDGFSYRSLPKNN
jgi:hypothetical protein